MTKDTFPVSYRDPVYAAADQAASAAAGIPSGLLSSIRLAGEKSNANQVSSAGATTPYQFTPTTRQLIIKKYNIDPTSSPQAAALGAAYLLKEGIERTGSAAGAVTQYIGGTDPANWGGQTRAYTNRVMSHFTKGGGQDTPQAEPIPAAPLPSAASYGLDPSVVGLGGAASPQPTATVQAPQAAAPGAGVNAQVVADYNAGRLSPEDMDAVDQRVKSGKLAIDPGALQRPTTAPAPNAAGASGPTQANPTTAPKPIGPQTLAAMQAGTLTPAQLATIKAGLDNGTLTMPAQAPQQAPAQDATGPQNDGYFVAGLPASAAPTAPQDPATAAKNGSTWSDVAEKAVGGVAGSLLDIASAGGRLVGANDFANQAQAAHQQIDAQMARDSSNSVAGKVAGAVGSAVPYVTMGGASLPGAVAGGAVAGAAPAVAQNKSGMEVARDAAVGAGAGAAGFGLGSVVGKGVSALAENPTVAKGIARIQEMFGKTPSAATKVAASGAAPDAQVAADIARATDNTPGGLATKLETAQAPQTPGYVPTAAELANDANVTTLQKANTNANPSIAANASANNDEAIARELAQQGTPNNPGTPANPQAADQAAEAAAQRSDALAAQGQAEVQPIAQDVAQKLQTPQFEAPVKLAQRMARDEGSTVFDDLQKARQAEAANTLEQIIGTPEQLDALKTARGAQAADDFLATHVGIPVDSPEMAALLKKPAIKKAIAQAETTAQNQGESSIFTTAQNRANANVGGAKSAPQKYVSGRGLVNAKAALDDQISAAARAGENSQVRTLQGVKNELLTVMDTAIPDYGKARANFAQASGPIDAMEAVQSRLYSAIDPVSKEVDPGKLVTAINSIKAEQMKPGIRAADKIPSDTIDALTELARHLQNKNDLTGLPAQGQEYIRRALASSEKHAGANAEFQKVLDAQSPAYKELHGAHAQNVASIESQRTSQSALAQAQEALQNADSPAGLRSIEKMLPDMEAADRAKAIALQQQKARELAMGEVQDRNLNSRGNTEFNRSTFKNASDKYSSFMSKEDAQQFANVAGDLQRQTTTYAKTGKIGGSDTAQNQSAGRRFGRNIGEAFRDSAVQSLIGGALGSAAGPFGTVGGLAAGAVTGAIGRTITQKVSSITTENAAKLLSNGKLLAAALRNYESLAARRLFVEQLSQKAGYVAGAAAANQFNSRR
ncbi:hypothetical protein BGLT_05183 [Caballeronia glathei]|uniref:Transglycosylase SLT domain-containing protein n=1 Tax=Caballeronia glathei TaxID=60547 RepID=A0A069PEY0_9BURK|nr:hypothetical protein [Caballeronia glathei]KDR39203.1 hypothetical protein BG61_34205 [Caballeronia glathei]CDY76111.1 hypothetical protein BGLT_05183 [Caballeronia glathei]